MVRDFQIPFLYLMRPQTECRRCSHLSDAPKYERTTNRRGREGELPSGVLGPSAEVSEGTPKSSRSRV